MLIRQLLLILDIVTHMGEDNNHLKALLLVQAQPIQERLVVVILILVKVKI
jgi:hypothetical protein